MTHGWVAVSLTDSTLGVAALTRYGHWNEKQHVPRHTHTAQIVEMKPEIHSFIILFQWRAWRWWRLRSVKMIWRSYEMRWLQEVAGGEMKEKLDIRHLTYRRPHRIISNQCAFFPSKFRVNCPCKYNFDDGKKVTPRRDVPNYPKVCPLGLCFHKQS